MKFTEEERRCYEMASRRFMSSRVPRYATGSQKRALGPTGCVKSLFWLIWLEVVLYAAMAAVGFWCLWEAWP